MTANEVAAWVSIIISVGNLIAIWIITDRYPR